MPREGEVQGEAKVQREAKVQGEDMEGREGEFDPQRLSPHQMRLLAKFLTTFNKTNMTRRDPSLDCATYQKNSSLFLPLLFISILHPLQDGVQVVRS